MHDAAIWGSCPRLSCTPRSRPDDYRSSTNANSICYNIQVALETYWHIGALELRRNQQVASCYAHVVVVVSSAVVNVRQRAALAEHTKGYYLLSNRYQRVVGG